MNLVNPDAIFSAHDHHGFLFTGDRQTGKMARYWAQNGRLYLHIIIIRTIEKFDKRDENAPFTLQCRSKDGTGTPSKLVSGTQNK